MRDVLCNLCAVQSRQSEFAECVTVTEYRWEYQIPHSQAVGCKGSHRSCNRAEVTLKSNFSGVKTCVMPLPVYLLLYC